MAVSTSQIDKLGDRLRKSDEVSPEDLALFQQIEEERAEALDAVTRILREIDVDGVGALSPTTRPKTIWTTIQKLKRERSRLSTVQDLVGARIVLEGGLMMQDDVVEAVGGRFDEYDVVDRREKPTHGYRAVHVIVTYDGVPVEIQIRTDFQDRWAQLFEKLGDLWGRQIRYGEPPDDPNAEALQLRIEGTDASVGLSRSSVLGLLQAVAGAVHYEEDAFARAERTLRSGCPRKLKKKCKKTMTEKRSMLELGQQLLSSFKQLAEVPNNADLP